MDRDAQWGDTVKLLVALIAALGLFCSSNAISQESRLPDALQDGRDLATGAAGATVNGIRLPPVDRSAGDVVPRYNDSPDGRYEGGRGNPAAAGTQQVIDCAAATPEQLAGYAGAQCNATNFLSRNSRTRPAVSIQRSDPLLSNAQIRAEQGRLIGLPSSMTSVTATTSTTADGEQCQTVINPGGGSSVTAVCHEQGALSERTCTVGRVIEVDADYQYQCRQTPLQVETVTCNRTRIVTCEVSADGCDNSGIVPGSTQGDMRTWFGPTGGGTYTLEFGTFADNYWGGYAAVYDRTLQFNVENPAGITLFHLVNASFDDWLLVSLNGNLVYVGPYGGDRLEVTSAPTTAIPSNGWCGTIDEYTSTWSCYVPSGRDGSRLYGTYGYCERRGTDSEGYGGTWYCGAVAGGMIQYGASSYGSPELRTSWNRSMSVDLRPYLVQGTNTIFMRTIVSGAGEGAIRINARMSCPRSCQDDWNDQCVPLAERAR